MNMTHQAADSRQASAKTSGASETPTSPGVSAAFVSGYRTGRPYFCPVHETYNRRCSADCREARREFQKARHALSQYWVNRRAGVRSIWNYNRKRQHEREMALQQLRRAIDRVGVDDPFLAEQLRSVFRAAMRKLARSAA